MADFKIIGAYDLGCFSHKGDVTFPILADIDGAHLMNYENKGNKFTNYNLAVKDNGFSVTNMFNEDSTVLMQITRPDETLYTFTVDSIVYDTFYFRTQIYLHATNVSNGVVSYK